jgi:hypothetical protein
MDMWLCPICGKWDVAKNMVPAIIKGVPCVDNETGEIHKNSTWFGKAHFACIEKYNKTHEPKYEIREYNENGKFLGKITPT